MFDPYEKWLGIPKDQRPVDYFRLLGIDPKEKDAEAIRAATKKRIALVSRHKEGSHAQLCDPLLKQIQKAQSTLLTPDKRKTYETWLRKQNGAKTSPTEEEMEEVEEVEAIEEDEPPRRNGAKNGKKKSKSGRKPAPQRGTPWLWIGLAGGVTAVVLVGGLVAFFLMRGKKTDAPASAPQVASAPQTEPARPAPEPKPKEEPKAPPPQPEPAKKDPPPKPAPGPARPPLVRPKVRKPRPQVAKLPVPDESALSRAVQEIRTTYAEDYAKKKSEDQLALAAKLLQPGREDRKNPAAWFALLREAHDAAVRAERPRLAVEAIEEMDRWFTIDAFDKKLQTLNALVKDGSEDAARAVAKAALFQAEQAVDVDRYDIALRLLDTVESALRKAKLDKQFLDKQLAALQEKRHEVQGFKDAYQKVVEAKEKLRQTPDDASANWVVGRHVCFFLNRWDEGLPLLAKGGKDEEAVLSRQDLTPPADIKAQIAAGDGWWERAKGQSGREKKALQERAVAWYELAQPVAEEGEKTRLMERMEEAMNVQPRLVRLLPGSFYGRSTEDRILLLREGGGTKQSEEAVERGLKWLADHQLPSGAWSNHDFKRIKKCNCTEHGQQFDIAGTAFGLLPFLGAGETPTRGRYAKVVSKGLAYLVQQQKQEGKFSDNMYENALATLAMCEAYGITKSPRYAASAQLAVQFIIDAQHTEGSWGYSPRTPGDTSVTGWQFAALKAGHFAGLPVPPAIFSRTGVFLNSVADPNGLGYGYKEKGAGRSTTAAGLLCRQYLGWWPSHPGFVKASEPLLRPENFVTKDKPSIYYLFYATQVMHHAGGDAWETWNPKLRDLLIEMQDQGKEPGKEHQKGSWSPRGDDYAQQGGRLMFTSLALLLLEVYYYNIPLHGFGSAVLQD